MNTIKSSNEEDLLQRANNVDSKIKSEEDQSKLGAAMTGDPPIEPAAAELPPPEEAAKVVALKETMFVVVRTTVARLQEKWEWSDPGDEWKRGVGELLAQCAEKYLGSFATTQSTETALLLMVGSWVVENVIAKGIPKFGKAKTEAEKPPDTDPPNPRSSRGDGIGEIYASEEAA